MKFASPLIRGRLLKRYKRFLADVLLDSGETVTATCPNTGSMMGLLSPGVGVWLSESDSPARKFRHTWELVEAELAGATCLVGINTNHPNRLVAEAIPQGAIPELAGYSSLRREVNYGQSSRIDILLEDGAQGTAYVEVKNVHLSRAPGLAEFPDSVTARGVKHLRELAAMAQEGHRAVMLFLIQRADALAFDLAADIDPAYAQAFALARTAGVEALAYRCRISPSEVVVDRAVPIRG